MTRCFFSDDGTFYPIQSQEFLDINGHPISGIIETMLPCISADHTNYAYRHAQIAFYPIRTRQIFVAYFSLLFGKADSPHRFKVRFTNSNKLLFTNMSPVNLSVCVRHLEVLMLPEMNINQSWSYRIQKDGIGYLRIITYSTYKMSLDKQVFHAEAFTAFKASDVKHLIVHICGNIDGMDIACLTLDGY